MGKLLSAYTALVDNNTITEDPIQIALLKKLEVVYKALLKQKSLLNKVWRRKQGIKGLYFWGSVGTGKTFLMDLFYDTLPFKDKIRLHFHRFMHEVQKRLTELQGTENPLNIVAKEFAKKTRVLCFDEFFVNDIGDAMILERLFKALFNEGITLIATSNIPPERLYLEGLHRKRFLPAIALIKDNCDVFHVVSVNDYRLRALEQAGLYFHPLNKESRHKMEGIFELLNEKSPIQETPIVIEGRQIDIIKKGDKVVWFDFSVICAPPRSQVDYLKIAESYDAVFISAVPIMTTDDLASITYFINLVDVFYDEKVKLVLSAETLPPDLYTEGEKRFEYERTISRLQEMQSKAYLSARHLSFQTL